MPRRSEKADTFDFLEGLPFRVVAFLSLALLPIGLLAMWQTKSLDETLQARTELSLIALTELASSGERRTILQALGTVEAQATILPNLEDDRPQGICDDIFGDLVRASAQYSFVGFLPIEGPIACSSETDVIPPDMIDGRVRALANSSDVSLLRIGSRLQPGIDLAVLMQPVRRDDRVIGQVTAAIPIETLSDAPDMMIDRTPLSMTILNQRGEVISSNGEELSEATVARIRETFPGEDIYNSQRRVFAGRNAAGEARQIAEITIVPGVALAVASWPSARDLDGTDNVLPSSTLPALMWLASLFVAYFAVHRLVVGPIQTMRRRMRLFAADRSLFETPEAGRLPRELYELDQTFNNMALDLMDDEARMEDSLREKNVLLKEVHHRVKNNLQMVSSIISMQIRATDQVSTARTLERLRDRVLNLATVHRFLYMATNVGRIDAPPLIREICGNIFAQIELTHPNLKTGVEVDAVELVPDQSVPLGLLIGEIIGQWQRNLPDEPSEQPAIHVSLRVTAPGTLQLWVRSSPVPEAPRSGDSDVSDQLLRAFALQLGGDLQRVESAEGIAAGLEFTMTTSVPDAMDY